MIEDSHEVDQDGDLTVLLHKSGEPFAVWTEDEDGRCSAQLPVSDDDKPSEHLEGAVASVDEEAEFFKSALPRLADSTDGNSEQRGDVKFRVSSKHLLLASPYFRSMLEGPWEECTEVEIEGFDENVLLILMNVIHNRHRRVPKIVDLEQLAKIAVIVNYFRCHEAAELYAEIWISHLRNQVPTEYGRELILWLLISWVFSDPDIFAAVTKVAVKKSPGPLPTLRLPIRLLIVEKIEQRRQEYVSEIIAFLHDLLARLRDSDDTLGYSEDVGFGVQETLVKLSFEGSSMLFGALAKEMTTHKFLDPRPTFPFLGYSFVAMVETVRSFRSPRWCEKTNVHSKCCPYPHRLDSFIGPAIDKLSAQQVGFKLADFAQEIEQKRPLETIQ